eukprot:470027-Pleurochrysis_carterae.AAC.1
MQQAKHGMHLAPVALGASACVGRVTHACSAHQQKNKDNELSGSAAVGVCGRAQAVAMEASACRRVQAIVCMGIYSTLGFEHMDLLHTCMFATHQLRATT